MIRVLLSAAALAATPATAQIMNPDGGSDAKARSDAAAAQAKADAATATAAQAKSAADSAASNLAAVQTQAAAAKSAADAAAVAAAAACVPLASVPPVEMPGGSAGSGNTCRLANAANNRISRTGVFTYNTSGAILCSGSTTCAWDTPLPAGAASYPLFFTPIGASGAPSIKCKVASTTNTGFTGAVCVQSVIGINLGNLVETNVFSASGQVFALSLPATQPNR